MALAGGADGRDFVRRILRATPAHLTGNGGLLCEIGAGREPLEAEFHGDFLERISTRAGLRFMRCVER